MWLYVQMLAAGSLQMKDSYLMVPATERSALTVAVLALQKMADTVVAASDCHQDGVQSITTLNLTA